MSDGGANWICAWGAGSSANPSHWRPLFKHLLQYGRLSSHLTRLILQEQTVRLDLRGKGRERERERNELASWTAKSRFRTTFSCLFWIPGLHLRRRHRAYRPFIAWEAICPSQEALICSSIKKLLVQMEALKKTYVMRSISRASPHPRQATPPN